MPEKYTCEYCGSLTAPGPDGNCPNCGASMSAIIKKENAIYEEKRKSEEEARRKREQEEENEERLYELGKTLLTSYLGAGSVKGAINNKTRSARRKADSLLKNIKSVLMLIILIVIIIILKKAGVLEYLYNLINNAIAGRAYISGIRVPLAYYSIFFS